MSEENNYDKDNLENVIEDLKVHQEELNQQNIELKDTQNELIGMRDRFHTLYELAPVAYLNFSYKGEILNANIEASKLLNRPRKNLENKPFMLFLNSESQNVFYEHISNIKEKQTSERIEIKLNIDNKNEVICLIESNYVADSNYILSALIDITELREKEKEVNRFSTAIENGPAIFMITDIEGNIEYVNPYFESITGYNRDEILGKDPSFFKTEKMTDDFYKSLWSEIKDGKTWHGRFCNKRKDGSHYWEDAAIAPVFDDEDNIINFIKISRDITERINFQRKLKESREYNRSVVRAIPDIIIKYDYQGEILDIITGPEDKLLYSAEEAEGKNIKDLYNEELVYEFHEKIELALQGDEEVSIEYSLEVPAGDLWFEARFVALNDTEVISLIRDVTERVERENKIQEYNLELELNKLELEKLNNKLDEEIEKARNIHQRTLFTEKTNHEKIAIEPYYQPAENLGGDFYDIISVGDKLIMYVSDVTGHGLDAAMLSSFIKSTINSFIAAKPISEVNPKSISEFLARQYNKEDYPDDYFICLELGIYDFQNYKFDYIQLGIQDSIFYYNSNNEIAELNTKSLPISSVVPMELIDFDYNTIYLKPGDTLVLNTDGITEQRMDNNYFRKSFRKTFYDSADFPPEFISANIQNEFYDFTGSIKGEDDITYLIMQVQDNNRVEQEFKINSSKEEVKNLKNRIQNTCSCNYHGNIFCMVIIEFIVNAAEHGNNFNQDKEIKVKIVNTDEYIYASVEDQGEGFDWRKVINQEIDFNLNSERGRGIMMATEGCDKVSYNHKGNKVFLVKYKG